MPPKRKAGTADGSKTGKMAKIETDASAAAVPKIANQQSVPYALTDIIGITAVVHETISWGLMHKSHAFLPRVSDMVLKALFLSICTSIDEATYAFGLMNAENSAVVWILNGGLTARALVYGQEQVEAMRNDKANWAKEKAILEAQWSGSVDGNGSQVATDGATKSNKNNS